MNATAPLQPNSMTAQDLSTTAEPVARRRILVVDHDDAIRLSVCAQLTQWGFDAEGENNGVSGLTRLARTSPATAFAGMLLEMDMPILGGMAVLQEMKDRHPTIPVIVMARVPHIDKLRSAVRLWAQEYIVKPLDQELLKRKCTSAFHATLPDLRGSTPPIPHSQINGR
ncbi:MAG: Response regulator [Nitrospira sp.]|nr:MAG: Response regulator [Nitrospira sp.]